MEGQRNAGIGIATSRSSAVDALLGGVAAFEINPSKCHMARILVRSYLEDSITEMVVCSGQVVPGGCFGRVRHGGRVEFRLGSGS